MKIRALKSFEGIRDLERTKKIGKDVFPKEGDIWEVSEERAKFLLEHNVIEIVNEEHIIGHKASDVEYVVPLDNESMDKLAKAIEEHIKEKPKKSKKKSKKK